MTYPYLNKGTGETRRELVTSLSTVCAAALKAVVNLETAVSRATQDVWSVVQILVADDCCPHADRVDL
jgi:hypothetical protein